MRRTYTETAALLQGHEDLRQDERVMQLFGLVNSMLTADRTTKEQDLSIARYAVIPLSPNSGGHAKRSPLHCQTRISAGLPGCPPAWPGQQHDDGRSHHHDAGSVHRTLRRHPIVS